MKILAYLTGKLCIAVLKPFFKQKKTTVLVFAICYPLFIITAVTSFAHPKSCELAGNTAEAIMTYNACKADAQAAQLSGHSKEETQHVLEDEMHQLREENSLLRKRLDDVRSVLFQLLQEL